jgi:hypothetical protein
MTLSQLILNIAPDVADLLGSDDAITAAFDIAELGYLCTACGQPGKLTETDTASVVIYLPDNGHGAPLVRWAHEHCMASQVVVTNAPTGTEPGSLWPAHALLRPHSEDPRAVILIGPRLAVLRKTAGGDTIEGTLSTLLGDGFHLLTDPDAAIPDVDGVAVRLGPDDRVAVVDGDGCPLIDAPMVLPPGWIEAATESGRVAVIVASGLNLLDPERHHLGDLFNAIRKGNAVAATAELLPTDDPV